jgi:hypothetical protein
LTCLATFKCTNRKAFVYWIEIFDSQKTNHKLAVLSTLLSFSANPNP